MADVNGTLTLVPPPPGYVVNFESPQRQLVIETYTVTVIENILAFLFLSQRIYTRTHLMRLFELEDVFVIIAWVFSSATQAVLLVAWHEGVLGVHAWEISLENYKLYARLIFASPLVYAPCMACSKAALCLFYRRLNPNRYYQIAVAATLFIDVGAYTGIFFSLLFSCRPIRAGWEPLLAPTAVCINQGAIYIATAVIGIVTDALIISIPIPTIWGLQMPRKQKIGLTAMFGVGSITLVTSTIRLKVLIPALTSIDQPWVIGEGAMWINIEANLLIICCCLPTVRRFLKHVAPTLIGEDGDNASPRESDSRRKRTWGSMGGRPKRRFDTLMNTIDDSDAKSNVQLEEKTVDSKRRSTREVRINGMRIRGDDGSEEAIFYERTVDVIYENV